MPWSTSLPLIASRTHLAFPPARVRAMILQVAAHDKAPSPSRREGWSSTDRGLRGEASERLGVSPGLCDRTHRRSSPRIPPERASGGRIRCDHASFRIGRTRAPYGGEGRCDGEGKGARPGRRRAPGRRCARARRAAEARGVPRSLPAPPVARAPLPVLPHRDRGGSRGTGAAGVNHAPALPGGGDRGGAGHSSARHPVIISFGPTETAPVEPTAGGRRSSDP